MIDHIENEYLQVSVQRTGVELSSLKSKKSQKEYIWQADPAVWGSHAPVLFPIIGALKDESFVYAGRTYKGLPKHGLVRRNEGLVLAEQETHLLRYELTYSADTLAIYPFKFGFSICFELLENELRISHEILNQGQETMLFSLGGHPGFICPRNPGEVYEDYYLEFEKPETDHTWTLSDRGLVDKVGDVLLDNSQVLDLHTHLFDKDALIFKQLHSRLVHLKSRKSTEYLSMSYSGFPYLGIWAKPGANFVCIEPWMGIADSEDSSGVLKEKEGIMTLAPQDTFAASYSIHIHE